MCYGGLGQSAVQLQTKTDGWLVEGLLFSKFMKIFNTFKTAQIDFYNGTFSCDNCTIRHKLHTKICPVASTSHLLVIMCPKCGHSSTKYISKYNSNC